MRKQKDRRFPLKGTPLEKGSMAVEWFNEFGHEPNVRIIAGVSQQTSSQDNSKREGV